MSEVRRLQKLSSDFSIASILADDRRASLSKNDSSSCKQNEKKLRDNIKKDYDRVQSTYVPSYLKISERNVSDNPSQDQKHIKSFSIVEHASGTNKSSFCSSLHLHVPGSVVYSELEPDQDHNATKISNAKRDHDPRSTNGSELPWLYCTRYKPPRLPRRSPAGRVIKRRPGKHPRIPFTAFQLQVLEDKYRKNAYLARRDVISLSTVLRLPQSRVKIWFQNRRARERRESLQIRYPAVESVSDVSQHQQTHTIVNREMGAQTATNITVKPSIDSCEDISISHTQI